MTQTDTQSLLDELSELEDDSISNTSVSSVCKSGHTSRSSCIPSHTSTPCSSHSSSSISRKCISKESDSFRLPVFSPDIKKCISKDAFYTTAQRNRLIREACMALRGYCWENELPNSNQEKRSLARSLYELAPKSLGDSESKSSPEAGLYGQIVRWFQNHAYFDRKACDGNAAKKRKISVEPSSSSSCGDDDEAIKCHLSELKKEVKKKSYDESKIARLMSVTFASRRNTILSLTANVRISTTLQEYPCLKKPIYLVEEMFNAIGVRFTSLDEVKKKISSLQKCWDTAIAPAIVQFAIKSGYPHPESNHVNVVTMYCLRLLVDKLKPKGGPPSSKRINSLICFAQTVDESLKENKENLHPYVICVGSITTFTSAIVVCNKKVVTLKIGNWVFSAVLTLLAVHYTYELAYNPSTQQVMEYLQEKLLADSLSGKKISTAYSNLYRAVNCIEQTLDQDRDKEGGSDDETQLSIDF